MFKYLLLIALGAAVWWIWRQRNRAPADPPRREAPAERMVACAHCGVHLPQGESLVEGEAHYCCEAHRRKGKPSSR